MIEGERRMGGEERGKVEGVGGGGMEGARGEEGREREYGLGSTEQTCTDCIVLWVYFVARES